jgi:hypothetical protein
MKIFPNTSKQKVENTGWSSGTESRKYRIVIRNESRKYNMVIKNTYPCEIMKD